MWFFHLQIGGTVMVINNEIIDFIETDNGGWLLPTSTTARTIWIETMRPAIGMIMTRCSISSTHTTTIYFFCRAYLKITSNILESIREDWWSILFYNHNNFTMHFPATQIANESAVQRVPSITCEANLATKFNPFAWQVRLQGFVGSRNACHS